MPINQELSWIAISLTWILKTSRSIKSTTRSREGIIRVNGDNRAEYDKSKLDRSGIGDDKIDDEDDNKVKKKSQKNLSKSKKTESSFLTSGAKIVFTKLRQAFIKAPIFYHFDLKCYI